MRSYHGGSLKAGQNTKKDMRFAALGRIAMFMTQPIHKAVRQKPDATAVIFQDTKYSYRQVAEDVSKFAGVLIDLGVKPGDRVGILSLNSYQYVVTVYGTFWAGGVINPVNIRWSPKEIAYSLDDCDTQVLFVDDAFAPVALQLSALSNSLKTLVFIGEGERPAGMLDLRDLKAGAASQQDAVRRGDDFAAVMYTGGTTGKPKGVTLTHNNLAIDALSATQATPRSANPTNIIAAPMFHIGGLGLTFQQIMLLGTQVILPIFNEVAILDVLQRYKCTEIFLVPTMMKMVIETETFDTYDVSSMKTIFYGASPIDEALLEKSMKAFPQAEFTQVYGMTELSPVVTALKPAEHHIEPGKPNRLRSAGEPISIAEIRIVDEDGNDVPSGQVGEITARGPMVMAGYWNNPEQTAEALRDGWMHTGDGGYLDDDGFLYVVDRIKDMVISGGENIFSSEVESAISLLPGVFMNAVVGLPDPKWGENVHAVVVLRDGISLTAEDVIAHCRNQIAHYKCPKTIEFRDSLPMSAAGKMLKYQLKAEATKSANDKV
jgi:acyl-CoA synthetase (AMP-forming)/AMP-acid ligase II